jgi:hypothetical protein
MRLRCNCFGWITGTTPLTELVAAKIIQVTRMGERDPPRICARALQELGIPLPD